jgi:hypothetical protein
MDKPRFTHDCSACVFLGQSDEYDLWWCPDREGTAGELASVILRHADDGPEYYSSHPPGAFAGAEEVLQQKADHANGVFSEKLKQDFEQRTLDHIQRNDRAYLKLMGEAVARGLYTGKFAHKFR